MQKMMSLLSYLVTRCDVGLIHGIANFFITSYVSFALNHPYEAKHVFSLLVTTRLENQYPVWTTGRGAGKPFIIDVTVQYPEETITYPCVAHKYSPCLCYHHDPITVVSRYNIVQYNIRISFLFHLFNRSSLAKYIIRYTIVKIQPYMNLKT